VNFHVLDSVVLERDVPEHGLRKGDLGTIVEVYQPDGLGVEFVVVSGETVAVVTLAARDVRRVSPEDLLTVRSVRR